MRFIALTLTTLALSAGSLPDGGVNTEVELLEPDVTKARELPRWPNEGDLARLKSVEGQTRAEVIRILGHPRAIERRADGREVWDYPWLASCQVHFRGNVAAWTFYTSGY
jgi:hypothetical protein